MPDGRLDGKVAIVTGGAGGIGRAIAQRYAAEGARVVVADVDAARAEEVAAGIGEALGVACDVTNRDDCDRVFATTLEQLRHRRRARQQRGPDAHRAALPGGRRRLVGPDRRGQPHRRVQHGAPGGADHVREAVGRDGQPLVRRRLEGAPRQRRLRRGEGRDRGVHARPRARPGAVRRAGLHARAGLDRHAGAARGGADQARRERAAGAGRHPRGPGRAGGLPGLGRRAAT